MPLLPNGFYQGQLLEIDQGDYWTWKFLIQHQGRTYDLKTFSSGKPYGKAKAYAEALLDRNLERGEALDADLLTGLSASLEVGTVKKDGREYNSIDSMV
jgi:hypothetical protein